MNEVIRQISLPPIALHKVRDLTYGGRKAFMQQRHSKLEDCLVYTTKRKVEQMSKQRGNPIPSAIREQVNQIVAHFNQGMIKNPECFYVPRYSGSYLYLDRHNYGPVGHICRLEWQGRIDNWEFAIYRYSKERYDPGERFFPGSGYVDGTVEGAMKAGLEAYPLSDYNNTSTLGRVLSFLLGGKG